MLQQAAASGLTFTKILGGISKTLGIANQAIPIYKEVKPMFSKAKTLFSVVKEFKNSGSVQKNKKNNEEIVSINTINLETKKEKKTENNLNPVFFQ